MSDPCPSCTAPLALDGTFCKECGYDLELLVADHRGEGAELPDDDDDYQRTLEREGLGQPPGSGMPGRGIPWGALAGLLVAIGLLLTILLLRAG